MESEDLNRPASRWYEPQPYNNWKQIVRVIVTPNSSDSDATLLVILDNPAVEEYIIKNKTNQPIRF